MDDELFHACIDQLKREQDDRLDFLIKQLPLFGLILLLSSLLELGKDSAVLDGRDPRSASSTENSVHQKVLLQSRADFSGIAWVAFCIFLKSCLLTAIVITILGGRRLGTMNGRVRLAVDRRAPVLYLRAFDRDEELIIEQKRTGCLIWLVSPNLALLLTVWRKLYKHNWLSPEERIRSIVDEIGPTVAIGPQEEFGFDRITTNASEWKDDVTQLMHSSQLTILRYDTLGSSRMGISGRGLRWEAEMLPKLVPPEKTVLYFEPARCINPALIQTLPGYPELSRLSGKYVRYVRFNADNTPYASLTFNAVLKRGTNPLERPLFVERFPRLSYGLLIAFTVIGLRHSSSNAGSSIATWSLGFLVFVAVTVHTLMCLHVARKAKRWNRYPLFWGLLAFIATPPFAFAMLNFLGFRWRHILRKQLNDEKLQRAKCTKRYSVTCECGETIPVRLSEAGIEVSCDCGAKVLVPDRSLLKRKMTQLK